MAVPPLLRTRLVWPSEAAIPPGEDSARVTVPEKPLRLVRVIVEVPETPTRRVWEVGLADMENSETFTVIAVEWVRVPLVALTVTV